MEDVSSEIAHYKKNKIECEFRSESDRKAYVRQRDGAYVMGELG
jgi:hypothetical protein